MNADTIQVTAESHFQKARCFIALNEVENAIEMFVQINQILPNDMLVNIDLQILELIGSAQESIAVLSKNDSSQQDILNSEKTLNSVIKSFSDLIKIYESGKLEKIKKQDAPLSIKLIPNNDRVKIEKA